MECEVLHQFSGCRIKPRGNRCLVRKKRIVYEPGDRSCSRFPVGVPVSVKESLFGGTVVIDIKDDRVTAVVQYRVSSGGKIRTGAVQQDNAIVTGGEIRWTGPLPYDEQTVMDI